MKAKLSALKSTLICISLLGISQVSLASSSYYSLSDTEAVIVGAVAGLILVDAVTHRRRSNHHHGSNVSTHRWHHRTQRAHDNYLGYNIHYGSHSAHHGSSHHSSSLHQSNHHQSSHYKSSHHYSHKSGHRKNKFHHSDGHNQNHRNKRHHKNKYRQKHHQENRQPRHQKGGHSNSQSRNRNFHTVNGQARVHTKMSDGRTGGREESSRRTDGRGVGSSGGVVKFAHF